MVTIYSLTHYILWNRKLDSCPLASHSQDHALLCSPIVKIAPTWGPWHSALLPSHLLPTIIYHIAITHLISKF